jgi:pseudouridine synthase
MAERLQKLMAQAGIASRRHAEEMILKGRVTVNGQRANLGDKADLTTDDVRVDGARLRVNDERIYIMLNKPMGIVTAVTAQEQESRRTVRDLIPVEGHLYPAGRLDADSEGLVILTNDGDLALKLTHPRYDHPKVYEVALVGSVPDDVFDIWRRGVVLDDGPTKPVEIKVLTRDKEMTWIRVTMREGRKRQIRRIATTLGHPVRQLIRTQFDTLVLGDLRRGAWRYLTPTEVEVLQKSAASTPHRVRVRRRPEGEKSAAPRSRAGASSPTRRTAKSSGLSSGRPASRTRKPASRTGRPSTGATRRRPAASGSSRRRTARLPSASSGPRRRPTPRRKSSE